MMKQMSSLRRLAFTAFVVMSFLPLVACGGGGGGTRGISSDLSKGSISTKIAGGAPYTGPANDKYDIVASSYLADYMTGEASVAGITLIKTGDATDGMYFDGDNVVFIIEGNQLPIPIEGFDLYGGNMPILAGKFDENDVIARLGSGLVPGGPLEFSDFGYWVAAQHIDVGADKASGFDNGEAFAFGSNDSKIVPLGEGGNASFTGAALGVAFSGTQDEATFASLTGTANLAVTGGGSTGSLDLIFPGFYDLSGTITSGLSGSQFNGSFDTIERNTDIAPINGIILPEDISAYGDKDFSGLAFNDTGSGAASEAVGIFGMFTDAGGQGFFGSFGVK